MIFKTKKQYFVPMLLIFHFLFIAVANFGHPVTPAYVKEIGINAKFFGYFFSVFSLGIVLSSSFWGNKGDLNGRKKYMLMGLFVYSITQFVFGYFPNKYIIMIARLTTGLFISAYGVNMMAAILYDATSETKVKLTSLLAGSSIVATSFGAYIGGIIGAYIHSPQINLGYGFVFIIQSASLFVLMILLAIFLPNVTEKSNAAFNKDTSSEIENSKVKTSKKNNLKDLFNNLKLFDKSVLNLFYLSFVVFIAITMNQKFLDNYITATLNYGTDVLGKYMLFSGGISLISLLIINPFLASRSSDLKLVQFSTFICAIATIITFNFFGSTNIITALYCVFPLFIVGRAVYEPNEISYLLSSSDQPNGILLGTRETFKSLGAIIATTIGGWIYEVSPIFLFNITVLLFGLVFIGFKFCCKEHVGD